MTSPVAGATTLLLASAAILALSTCSPSSSSDPSPWLTQGTTPQEQSSAILTTVLADEAAPGCSAAVARRGEVVWADARGAARVSSGDPLTTDTVFGIASISKHITGMAILTLVADGDIRLDEPVADFLPDAGPWTASTTVEQLLHHTSGLADYILLLQDEGVTIADPVSQEEALSPLRGLSAQETPASWEYSNSNYIVLASIVEEVSGTSFGAFVEDRLFAPLASSLRVDPLAEYPAIAARYHGASTSASEIAVRWDVVGDGSVVASPSALAVWFDVMRTGLDAYPSVVDQMAAGAVEIPGAEGTVSYGAGVMADETGGFWHTGSWQGHMSYVAMSDDHDMTLAVLCNSDTLDVPYGTLIVALTDLWF